MNKILFEIKKKVRFNPLITEFTVCKQQLRRRFNKEKREDMSYVC